LPFSKWRFFFNHGPRGSAGLEPRHMSVTPSYRLHHWTLRSTVPSAPSCRRSESPHSFTPKGDLGIQF
jgi:hypothetical protein